MLIDCQNKYSRDLVPQLENFSLCLQIIVFSLSEFDVYLQLNYW